MAQGNTLIDNIPENEGPTPAKGAKRLRVAAGQTTKVVSNWLVLAEKMVSKHTRAALVTELGDDAAAMIAFHQACKAFIASQAPGLDSPDLPE